MEWKKVHFTTIFGVEFVDKARLFQDFYGSSFILCELFNTLYDHSRLGLLE